MESIILRRFLLLSIFLISFFCTELSARMCDSLYHTTIIIECLPMNTPYDASLYIASSSRGWFPDMNENKFVRREDGSYSLSIDHNQPYFEYKITRGSWRAVEGRTNGRARPNRIYSAKQDHNEIKLSVSSWEDLSKGSYNAYVYLLYLAVLQAILLIVAINTIRNKNKYANGVLSVLLFLIALALVGRASTYDRDVFNWAPKMLLIPEIILFTYAPVFYLYIHYLLRLPLKWKKYWWIHFIPAVIHVLLYLPYLQMNDQTFIYRVLDKELFMVFASSGAVALFFNIGYWLLCFRVVESGKQKEQQNENYQKYIRFLKVVLSIKAIYLSLWIFLSGVFFVGFLIDMDMLWVTETCIDILWVLFSLITVCLAYYAMKQPELFTRPLKKTEQKKYKDSVLPNDEFEKIKERLYDLIDNKKIYQNPDLTLPQLSHQIPTTVHALSRVINEGFDQTFSQFINERRVKEFIQIVSSEKEYDSFLSLAFRVGFNSKTTFNRSFKKYTGTTPRLYFTKG